MDRPDLAWKLLLRRRLRAVLDLLFPKIHVLVDWAQGHFLPDKSLPPLTADSRTGEREPDFIAIVSLLDGSEACVHVEVQCTRQARFTERMQLYHARLRDRFGMHVISLAILGDPSPTWRPDGAADLIEGYGTTFHFPIVKLLDFRDRRALLLEAHEPAAMAIATHLIAIDTRRKPELRYAAKRRLLRTLHKNYSVCRELNELQAVIDWMLPLPAAWQRRMIMDIEQFILEHESLDKNSLNYLIPELLLQRCKKLAEAEGRAKGLAKGQAEGLTKGRAEGLAEGATSGEIAGQCRTLAIQLEAQFGRLPAKVVDALAQASSPQRERLAVALLDAGSLAEALNAAGLRV